MRSLESREDGQFVLLGVLLLMIAWIRGRERGLKCILGGREHEERSGVEIAIGAFGDKRQSAQP